MADINLDDITRQQYEKYFGDLSPEEKIESLGGEGDRIRRERPYQEAENFEHLGVVRDVYFTLLIEVLDDLAQPLSDIDIMANGSSIGTTDYEGLFRKSLPGGDGVTYDLEISAQDYATYTNTITLDQTIELSIQLDYDGFRANDPNLMYWGTATEPGTIDSTFVNSLAHDELSNDITRSFTLAPSNEYIWYAHPARLGQVIMSQTLGDLNYTDTYQTTITVNNSEGEEDYEVHRTPNQLDSTDVSIEIKERP